MTLNWPPCMPTVDIYLVLYEPKVNLHQLNVNIHVFLLNILFSAISIHISGDPASESLK